MKVEFDEAFLKSAKKIKGQSTRKKISEAILKLESCSDLKDIKNIKKLIGFKNLYRIRIGDYRIGFELIENKVVLLIIVSHRKDIYKKFP